MSTIADLRGRIAAIDDQKILLTSERDEIAFAALIENDKKAVTLLP